MTCGVDQFVSLWFPTEVATESKNLEVMRKFSEQYAKRWVSAAWCCAGVFAVQGSNSSNTSCYHTSRTLRGVLLVCSNEAACINISNLVASKHNFTAVLRLGMLCMQMRVCIPPAHLCLPVCVFPLLVHVQVWNLFLRRQVCNSSRHPGLGRA